MEEREKKQFIALGVTVVALIIVAVLVYFFILNKKDEIDTRQPIDVVDVTKKGSELVVDDAPIKYADPIKIEVKEMGQRGVEKFAISFAERYGSYSNQSNFDNFTVLEESMTDKMKTWAKSYVAQQRDKKMSNTIYYGIITKAVASEVEEFDNDYGFGSFLVMTRRKESFISKNGSADVFNQNIRVKVVKEGKTWKVDGAFWDERN